MEAAIVVKISGANLYCSATTDSDGKMAVTEFMRLVVVAVPFPNAVLSSANRTSTRGVPSQRLKTYSHISSVTLA